MKDIRALLAQEAPLVFDGATGTYFAARYGGSCELASLEQPEKVLQMHRAYLDAGCQAVKTNTFALGAMYQEGGESLARKAILAGCMLAREAAAPYGAYVFGDLGPVAALEDADPAAIYLAQAQLFLSQGITHFLLETLSSDQGVADFARQLKALCPSVFLLVSFGVQPDGYTREGLSASRLLAGMQACEGVDAVGFNCVCGPQHMLRQFRRLDAKGALLSAMPNAGYPTVLGRRVVYRGQPDYFAQQGLALVRAGAKIIGGCCGTTPAHIAALVQAIRREKPVAAQAPAAPSPAPAPAPRAAQSPLAPNPLWDKLEAGKRVVVVELDPPAQGSAQPFMEAAARLQAAGADGITVADCPIGRPRADSSLLSCKLKRELGIEPLPHLACRDRNLSATRALLLGLSMEGIRNVLLVTGDPVPGGQEDMVKGVFHFNARKLAGYVAAMNDTVFPNPMRAYGALNVNAKNFQIQLKLAQEKEANGICAFLTQPVHSQEALENLKLARQTLKGKILGGVLPIVSYRNACFLNNEIAGVFVCEQILAQYQDKDRAQGEALAVEISCAIGEAMAPYTDGLYLMTPFNRISLMETIMERLV